MKESIYTRLDTPIIISFVLHPTDQIVGAFLEDAEVAELFQYGLSDYTYHAFWKMGKYECALQAHSNKFLDDPDELGALEWVIWNGTIIPKIFNRSHIERIKWRNL